MQKCATKSDTSGHCLGSTGAREQGNKGGGRGKGGGGTRGSRKEWVGGKRGERGG